MSVPPAHLAAADQRRAEAVSWFLRQQRGRLGEAEQAQFDAWRSDPDNVAALGKAARIWDAVSQLESDPQLIGVREGVLGRIERRRLFLTAAVAASVALAVFGAFMFTPSRPTAVALPKSVARLVGAQQSTYATDVGERSTITLQDGSVMTLNTNSAAKVAFDHQERRVTLIRGQAMFEVAKHPPRLFVVYAGDRRIVATGTAFDVRLDRATVEVVLVEGRVRVAATMSATWTPMSPGERLVAKGADTVSVTPTNVDRAMSWTSGKIVFRDARLDEAVAEVNRYTRMPISLAEADLGGLQINGVFRAGQPAEFARAVAQIHPLALFEETDGRIRLAPR